MEAIEEQKMEQLLRFDTHTKGNALDLVITNCPEREVNISDEGRLGKRDHCILLIEVEDTDRANKRRNRD